MRRLFEIPALAMLVILSPAHAEVFTITVTPALAPNAFGSPSYAGWVDNAISALRTGATSAGTSGTPTYYQAQNVVDGRQTIVTGFPSWLGQADPGTVFGPAFANELGNRMHFGLYINGNGTQFSISQLSFSASSNDPANLLGFGFNQGDYDYNAGYVGILKGSDGMLGTADDVYITSGANTQLVDALVGRGSGNSQDAYCSGCSIADQQAAIDEGFAKLQGITEFTGTYTLGNDSGSGTFEITGTTPEPSTWLLMFSAIPAIRLLRRR
jgi:hypothetical protein